MNGSFSTPLWAPLVPKLPIRFRNTTILSVFYRSDRERIARELPPPLEPGSDLVVAHFYHMADPDWFGPHFEFALQVDAVLPATGVRGAYSPLLMLTTDGGLATGREIYGQPKKLGQPRLEVRGDLVVGVAERNGIEAVTATLPYKQLTAQPSELTAFFPFTTNINYKFIPDIAGQPAVRQLTARSFEEVTVHECWQGDATLEVRPHAQFPAHRLPVREVVRGFYWRVDLTLPFGRVIHDYL
jgi:acetoacetate decarboxylase